MKRTGRLLLLVAILVLPQVVRGEGRGGAAFSPDGSMLAIPSGDGTVTVWDVTAGKELAGIYEPFDPLFVGATVWRTDPLVAFSPNGKLLATHRYREPVKLWRVTDASEVASLDGAKYVSHLEFSSDGRRLMAFGAENKTSGRNCLALWDVPTGRERLTRREMDGTEFQQVELSPDGKLLLAVVGPRDVGLRTIRLWDTEDGKERAHLTADAALFAPTGQVLALWGADGSIRFWDTTTGQERTLMPAVAPRDR